MTKITLEVDHDQLVTWMVQELQESYIDHVTNWKHEPDCEHTSNSIINVISLYMIPSKFEAWYETIKEL